MVVTMAQVGFVFSGKGLKPKGERLNPFAGLKRMVSMKALWETFKSTAKFGIVAAAAIPSTIAVARDLINGEKMETVTVLTYVAQSAVAMVRMIAFIALIIAFADYIYQRRSISKSLMMTKTELKQEMRNSEGDPMVKGRMRSLQRALSSNRMMAEVNDANVVIMNPTHFAVALRYRPNEGAPRVVAKGRDAVALRIRDKAHEASVPVVEAPPLARAIFKACELEQEIPHRLFTAVAKVLAFVHRHPGPQLAQRRLRDPRHHRRRGVTGSGGRPGVQGEALDAEGEAPEGAMAGLGDVEVGAAEAAVGGHAVAAHQLVDDDAVDHHAHAVAVRGRHVQACRRRRRTCRRGSGVGQLDDHLGRAVAPAPSPAG